VNFQRKIITGTVLAWLAMGVMAWDLFEGAPPGTGVVLAQGMIAPAPAGGQGATLGSNIQSWDPYSTSYSNTFAQPPSIGATSNYPGATYPQVSYPQAGGYAPPPAYPPPPGGPPPGFAGGPPAMFPQQQPAPLFATNDPFGQQFGPLPYERFLQNVSFQYTWLPKLTDSDTALQIHDFEVSTTALFPNFMHSAQPLLVTPGFVLHLWDGPSDLVHDLPSRAYSAYLDLGWNPEITPQVFAELGFRAGIYSDFNQITNNSLRLQGLGVLNLRLTPTVTIKGGAVYINRLDKKLLPVVGLVWEPDSLSRYDITFPYPRISKYLTTLGDKKVWWYIGGEYGGGSWTIKRHDFVTMDEVGDQIDINDLRVFAGLEATHANNMKAFIEVGYVWDRKIIYRSELSNLGLDDTMMVRAGFCF